MSKQYTCSHYRQEMILLALMRRLKDPELEEDRKADLEKQIRRLKAEMGME